MNIMEMLAAAQGIRILYDYGFELRDENFVELTFDQYQALKRQGVDTTQRWFRVTRGRFEDVNNPPAELPIVSESERESIFRAVRIIYRMSDASGGAFGSFRERLEYLRSRLPPIMVGGEY
jgi:hypothetical protein